MNKLVILGLIIVLCLGAFAGIHAFSLNGAFLNNPQTESSTTPSNIIDHLPFIINTSDVYYLAKDLTVNGTGITILVDNVVLIGQGHKIVGNGTGSGLATPYASHVAVIGCNIENFKTGIFAQLSGFVLISRNRIHSNWRAIFIDGGGGNIIRENLVFNNNFGLVISGSYPNQIDNNYFWNNDDNAFDDGLNYWNTSKSQEVSVINGPYRGGNYWHDYAGTDTDGDGIGDTDLPYTCNGRIWYTGDYLPSVDILPPSYNLTLFDFGHPNISLNVTWKDNAQLDTVILQFDGINYTDLVKTDENLDFNEFHLIEHKATYDRQFQNLSFGSHYYRWFANDTRNQWNSTELQSFNVVATPVINSVDVSPVLKISANITCEGTSNISELMDYVALHYEIDDNWFAMNMTFDQQTSLYSAFTVEYNQLAGKTIQYYIVAEDKNSNIIASETLTYQVPDSVGSDLNRDGIIDIFDIVAVALRFGEIVP